MAAIFRNLLLGLSAALLAPSLAAKTFDNRQAKQWEFDLREFACPLTGKRFSQAVTHPHMVLASFPDGSHMGDEWVDQQIPECPDNRVPILPDYTASEEGSGQLAYHDYSADELAALPALLASDNWQAMLDQTRTLRTYWLAKQLGRPALDRFELLLHSPWGAEDEIQRRTALQWFVADLPAIIDERRLDAGQAAFARYQVVNALRELGRFDEALALLEAIEAATPGVRMATDPDAMFAAPEFAGPMRAVIAARDDDRYAIGLLSDDMAGRICNSPMFADYRGANAARACADRQAQIEREEAVRQASFKLREDEPALDRSCLETPTDQRTEALAAACDFRQAERDRIEADRLAEEEPEKIVAACADRAAEFADGPMFYGCIRYRTRFGGVLEHLLVRDGESYAVLCERFPVTYDDDAELSLACNSAREHRADIAALELWRDLPALRKFCKATAVDDRTLAEIKACVDLAFYSESKPPPAHALEYRDGPIFFDRLGELIVPQARALVADKLARTAAETAD